MKAHTNFASIRFFCHDFEVFIRKKTHIFGYVTNLSRKLKLSKDFLVILAGWPPTTTSQSLVSFCHRDCHSHHHHLKLKCIQSNKTSQSHKNFTNQDKYWENKSLHEQINRKLEGINFCKGFVTCPKVCVFLWPNLKIVIKNKRKVRILLWQKFKRVTKM